MLATIATPICAQTRLDTAALYRRAARELRLPRGTVVKELEGYSPRAGVGDTIASGIDGLFYHGADLASFPFCSGTTARESAHWMLVPGPIRVVDANVRVTLAKVCQIRVVGGGSRSAMHEMFFDFRRGSPSIRPVITTLDRGGIPSDSLKQLLPPVLPGMRYVEYPDEPDTTVWWMMLVVMLVVLYVARRTDHREVDAVMRVRLEQATQSGMDATRRTIARIPDRRAVREGIRSGAREGAAVTLEALKGTYRTAVGPRQSIVELGDLGRRLWVGILVGAALAVFSAAPIFGEYGIPALILVGGPAAAIGAFMSAVHTLVLQASPYRGPAISAALAVVMSQWLIAIDDGLLRELRGPVIALAFLYGVLMGLFAFRETAQPRS